MSNRTGLASSHKATFFGGVAVLAVANLLVKVFGFLYKVPLNRVLGDEMANVNAAYSVYTLLYMISTAGIPVAVSVLISEARAEGHRRALTRIFRVALFALALIGALGTAGMLAFAFPISLANSGGDAYLCLLAIAPALFFICITSVLRGYFQGFGQMTPTAVSGVIESSLKMALGLVLVRLVLRHGGDSRLAAAYSVFAITVGIACGTLYLGMTYLRRQKEGVLPLAGDGASLPSYRSLLFRILKISVPIALASGVLSFSSLIDGQMLRPLLTDYYGDAALAKAVFSDYSTGAVTLFNLPAVFVYPIASVLVPYITAARVRGRGEESVEYIASAIRMAALLSLPAALGMSVLARPILSVVFLGDADMAIHAGGLLSLLALAVFPLSLLAVTGAVLQAFGEQGKPLFSMLAGVLLKIAVLLFLTPRIGALAAPLGTLLFYLVALFVNLCFMVRTCPRLPSLLRECAPAILASLLSSLGAYLAFHAAQELSKTVALLLAVAVAAVIYFVLVLLLGGIRSEDLLLLPKGEKIAKFLSRHHLLKTE